MVRRPPQGPRILILAFGFLALCAALEMRSRGDRLLRPGGSSDRFWRLLGTGCGILAMVGPLGLMAKASVAQGAGA